MAHNILRTCGLIATSMVSVMANAQTGANRLPNIVFVLTDDIGETNDLSDQYPEKVSKLRNLLKEVRTDSDIFRWK